MDEQPTEPPQPDPSAAGGNPPPTSYEPAPWPSNPQPPPYAQAPPYPQPYPQSPPYPQPFPQSPPYPQATPYPQPFSESPQSSLQPQNYPPAYPAAGSFPGPNGGGAPLAPPPDRTAAEPWFEPRDLRAAVLLAGVLVVVGILAGVLWTMISPHAQGIVISKTEISPLEQESWIAADGRFAIITAVIGLVAGAAAWFWRAQRGPVLVAGLAIGAGLGALLTALVGYWLSSGHDTGKVNTVIRLRVHVHAHGLIALEAVLALAAYLVGVLFSAPDDLGRPAAGESVGEPGTPVGVGGQPG